LPLKRYRLRAALTTGSAREIVSDTYKTEFGTRYNSDAANSGLV